MDVKGGWLRSMKRIDCRSDGDVIVENNGRRRVGRKEKETISPCGK